MLHIAIAVLIWCVAACALASDYYGVPLGQLSNDDLGITGSVYIANATAVQVTGFKLGSQQDDHELQFAFSNKHESEPVKRVYRIVRTKRGEEFSIPVERILNRSGVENERLVAIVPKKGLRNWTHFGVISRKSWKYLAAVAINKPAPQPYCCLADKENPRKGIIGRHYNASTGPIALIDARTVAFQSFSLKANKAPDAWVFAGNGAVNQKSGKKAMVVGRDLPGHHCSLRDEYGGNAELVAQLATGQTLYDVDYLSLFCYQYDVDFGHLSFKLSPSERPLPAYIPPIVEQLPADGDDDTKNEDEDTC